MRPCLPAIVTIVALSVLGCDDDADAPQAAATGTSTIPAAAALRADPDAPVIPFQPDAECGRRVDLICSSFVSQGPGKPCADAVHVADLREVRTAKTFWPAREVPFTDAWTCGSGGPLFIMYGDVQVSYAFDQGEIPLVELAAASKRRIVTVQGRPAVAGAGVPGKRIFSSAEFNVGRDIVYVLAQPEVPLAEVLRVAELLDLPPYAG